jgi:hypothetical protein
MAFMGVELITLGIVRLGIGREAFSPRPAVIIVATQ